MRFCEQFLIVPVLEPEDHAAGVDGDSVKVSGLQHLAIVLSFGDLTGDAVLTVNSGATDGTKTTAETFRYRLTGADLKNAGADQFGTETTSAGLTLTAASYNDRTLVVEINPDELTAGQEFVTIALSSAASALFASATAFGVPRYKSDNPPTAIPTT